MGLPNVVEYIKNVGKSIKYVAAEELENTMPSSVKFLKSNQEVFQTAYKAIVDNRNTLRLIGRRVKSSKVYEAADIGIHALFEDLTTGKFYNKERDADLSIKAMGGMDDFGIGGDDDFGDIDFDFDDFGNFGDDADEPTVDKKAAKQAAKQAAVTRDIARESSGAISQTIARSTQVAIENSRASTNFLFQQFSGQMTNLNSTLSGITDIVGQAHKNQSEAFKVHADNSMKFFDATSKDLNEIKAILKEMVEMDRNRYKSEQEKDRPKKASFSDIIDDGIPDLNVYFERIKSNAKNVGGPLSMLSSFEGNALATLFSTPLKIIPEMMVKMIVPGTLKYAAEEFDKTIGSVFGILMGRASQAANSENVLQQTLGKLLGVKSGLTTSLKSEGVADKEVPFDAVVREAIITEIPTYLRKILSYMSGEEELIFDRSRGEFINGRDLEETVKKIQETQINQAFSDLTTEMNKLLKDFRHSTLEDKERAEETFKKIKQALYTKGHNVNLNDLDWPAAEELLGLSYNDQYGYAMWREIAKNVKKSTYASLDRKIFEAREQQNRIFEDYQKRGVYAATYNNSNPTQFMRYDRYKNDITRDLKGTKGGGSIGLDKYGNDLYFYLQNMYTELSNIRIFSSRLDDTLNLVNSKISYSYDRGNKKKGKKGNRNNVEQIQDSNIITRNEDKLVYNPLDDSENKRKSKDPTKASAEARRKASENYKENIKKSVEKKDNNLVLIDPDPLGNDSDEFKHVSALIRSNLALRKKKYDEDDIKAYIEGDRYEGIIGDILRDYDKMIEENKKKSEDTGSILKRLKRRREEGYSNLDYDDDDDEDEDEYDENGKKKTKTTSDDDDIKAEDILADITTIIKRPSEFIEEMLIRANDKIYDLFFGKSAKIDPETGERLDTIPKQIGYKFKEVFKDVKKYTIEQFIDPLKKRLGIDENDSLFKGIIKKLNLEDEIYGENGIIAQVKDQLIETGQFIYEQLEGTFVPDKEQNKTNSTDSTTSSTSYTSSTVSTAEYEDLNNKQRLASADTRLEYFENTFMDKVLSIMEKDTEKLQEAVDRIYDDGTTKKFNEEREKLLNQFNKQLDDQGNEIEKSKDIQDIINTFNLKADEDGNYDEKKLLNQFKIISEELDNNTYDDTDTKDVAEKVKAMYQSYINARDASNKNIKLKNKYLNAAQNYSAVGKYDKKMKERQKELEKLNSKKLLTEDDIKELYEIRKIQEQVNQYNEFKEEAVNDTNSAFIQEIYKLDDVDMDKDLNALQKISILKNQIDTIKNNLDLLKESDDERIKQNLPNLEKDYNATIDKYSEEIDNLRSGLSMFGLDKYIKDSSNKTEATEAKQKRKENRIREKEEKKRKAEQEKAEKDEADILLIFTKAGALDPELHLKIETEFKALADELKVPYTDSTFSDPDEAKRFLNKLNEAYRRSNDLEVDSSALLKFKQDTNKLYSSYQKSMEDSKSIQSIFNTNDESGIEATREFIERFILTEDQIKKLKDENDSSITRDKLNIVAQAINKHAGQEISTGKRKVDKELNNARWAEFLQSKGIELEEGQTIDDYKKNLKERDKSNGTNSYGLRMQEYDQFLVDNNYTDENIKNQRDDEYRTMMDKLGFTNKSIMDQVKIGDFAKFINSASNISKNEDIDDETRDAIKSIFPGNAFGGLTGTPTVLTALSKGESINGTIVPKTDVYRVPVGLKVEPNGKGDPIGEAKAKKNFISRMYDNIKGYDQGGVVENPADADQEATKTTMMDMAIDAIQEPAGEFFRNVGTSLFGQIYTGDNSKKDKSLTAKDVVDKVKQKLPKGIAGGILGLGAGLIGLSPFGIMGSLLLGSALSVASSSDTVKNFLFGEMDEETNERKGGVISKEVQDAINKYLPNMTKTGVTGAVIGTLIPGIGPLGGLLIGSAIGWVKSNDSIREMIFGEEDGLINKEKQDAIKKAFPNIALATIGTMLFGPFGGILPNAILGAGLGFLSTTDGFKDAVFGPEDSNGERHGGILGAVHDYVVGPLKEFAIDFKDKVLHFIQMELIMPLKDALKPLAKQIEIMAKGIFRISGSALGWIWDHTFGGPLGAWIKDTILDPASSLIGKLFKALTWPVRTLIKAPFKLVGWLGDQARNYQINTGNADYMTAKERLAWRKSHPGRNSVFDTDRMNEQDETLAAMNLEQIEESLSALRSVKEQEGFHKKEFKRSTKDIKEKIFKIYDNKAADGPGSKRIRKDINRAIDKGDFDKVFRLMASAPTRNGNAIDTDRLEYEMADLLARQDELQAITTNKAAADKKTAQLQEIYKKQFGIKLKGRELEKVIANYEAERKARQKDNEKGKVKDPTALLSNEITNSLDTNTLKVIDVINGLGNDLKEILESTKNREINILDLEDDENFQNIIRRNLVQKQNAMEEMANITSGISSNKKEAKAFLKELGLSDEDIKDIEKNNENALTQRGTYEDIFKYLRSNKNIIKDSENYGLVRALLSKEWYDDGTAKNANALEKIFYLLQQDSNIKSSTAKEYATKYTDSEVSAVGKLIGQGGAYNRGKASNDALNELKIYLKANGLIDDSDDFDLRSMPEEYKDMFKSFLNLELNNADYNSENINDRAIKIRERNNYGKVFDPKNKGANRHGWNLFNLVPSAINATLDNKTVKQSASDTKQFLFNTAFGNRSNVYQKELEELMPKLQFLNSIGAVSDEEIAAITNTDTSAYEMYNILKNNKEYINQMYERFNDEAYADYSIEDIKKQAKESAEFHDSLHPQTRASKIKEGLTDVANDINGRGYINLALDLLRGKATASAIGAAANIASGPTVQSIISSNIVKKVLGAYGLHKLDKYLYDRRDKKEGSYRDAQIMEMGDYRLYQFGQDLIEKFMSPNFNRTDLLREITEMKIDGRLEHDDYYSQAVEYLENREIIRWDEESKSYVITDKYQDAFSSYDKQSGDKKKYKDEIPVVDSSGENVEKLLNKVTRAYGQKILRGNRKDIVEAYYNGYYRKKHPESNDVSIAAIMSTVLDDSNKDDDVFVYFKNGELYKIIKAEEALASIENHAKGGITGSQILKNNAYFAEFLKMQDEDDGRENLEEYKKGFMSNIHDMFGNDIKTDSRDFNIFKDIESHAYGGVTGANGTTTDYLAMKHQLEERENAESKGPKEYTQTHLTEYGAINYIYKKKSDDPQDLPTVIMANDQTTQKTLQAREENNNVTKNIFASLKDRVLGIGEWLKESIIPDSAKEKIDNFKNILEKVFLGATALGALPYISKGINWLGEKLIEKFPSLEEKLNAIKDAIGGVVTTIKDGIVDFAKGFWGWFAKGESVSFKIFGEEINIKSFKDMLTQDIIPYYVGGISFLFSDIFPVVTEALFVALPDILSGAVNGVGKLIYNLWNRPAKSKKIEEVELEKKQSKGVDVTKGYSKYAAAFDFNGTDYDPGTGSNGSGSGIGGDEEYDSSGNPEEYMTEEEQEAQAARNQELYGVKRKSYSRTFLENSAKVLSRNFLTQGRYGFGFKPVTRGVGKLVSKIPIVGKPTQLVFNAMGDAVDLSGKLGKQVLGKGTKRATEEIAEKGVKGALKEGTEAVAKEMTEEAIEKGAKEAGEKAAKEAIRGSGRKSARAVKSAADSARKAAEKEFREKAAAKVTKEVAEEAMEKGAKEAAGTIGEQMGKSKGLKEKFIKFFTDSMNKLANSKQVANILKKAGKNTNILKKAMDKFIPSIVKRIASSFAKVATKVATKLTAMMATAGGSAVIFGVADFISGYNRAAEILGIDKPGFAEKLLAGVYNVIKGAFLLTAIIPDSIVINLLIEHVLPAFGVDTEEFKQKREEAVEAAAAYNEEHGLDGDAALSVEEYLHKNNANLYTKVADGAGGIVKGAWDGVKAVGGVAWKGIKAAGNVVGGAVGAVVNNYKAHKVKGVWIAPDGTYYVENNKDKAIGVSAIEMLAKGLSFGTVEHYDTSENYIETLSMQEFNEIKKYCIFDADKEITKQSGIKSSIVGSLTNIKKAASAAWSGLKAAGGAIANVAKGAVNAVANNYRAHSVKGVWIGPDGTYYVENNKDKAIGLSITEAVAKGFSYGTVEHYDTSENYIETISMQEFNEIKRYCIYDADKEITKRAGIKSAISGTLTNIKQNIATAWKGLSTIKTFLVGGEKKARTVKGAWVSPSGDYYLANEDGTKYTKYNDGAKLEEDISVEEFNERKVSEGLTFDSENEYAIEKPEQVKGFLFKVKDWAVNKLTELGNKAKELGEKVGKGIVKNIKIISGKQAIGAWVSSNGDYYVASASLDGGLVYTKYNAGVILESDIEKEDFENRKVDEKLVFDTENDYPTEPWQGVKTFIKGVREFFNKLFGTKEKESEDNEKMMEKDKEKQDKYNKSRLDPEDKELLDKMNLGKSEALISPTDSMTYVYRNGKFESYNKSGAKGKTYTIKEMYELYTKEGLVKDAIPANITKGAKLTKSVTKNLSSSMNNNITRADAEAVLLRTSHSMTSSSITSQGTRSIFDRQVTAGMGKRRPRYGTGYMTMMDFENVPYNSSSDTFEQTIGDSGCGIIAGVNAVSKLTGKSANVVDAANMAVANGYKETDGGTKPGFFNKLFKANGLKSSISYNKSNIKSSLMSGKTMVLSGQNKSGSGDSPYSVSNPHYVLATGIDKSGKAIIQDPQDYRQNVRYDLDKLLSSTEFGISGAKYGMGEDDAKKAYIFLKKSGYPDVNIAGILGNWYAESGVDPTGLEGIYDEPNKIGPRKTNALKDLTYYTTRVLGKTKDAYKGDDGKYYPGLGLGQWTGPRGQNLMNTTKSKNRNWYSIEAQLDFMMHNDSRPKVMERFRTPYSSPVEAAERFRLDWEGITDGSTGKRHRAAEDYYKKMQDPNWTQGVDIDMIGGGTNTGLDVMSDTEQIGFFSKLSNEFNRLFSAIGALLFGGSVSGGASLDGFTSNGAFGQRVVDYMKSKEGKLEYTKTSKRANPGPDGGYGDCSSTAIWALNKAAGKELVNPSGNSDTLINLSDSVAPWVDKTTGNPKTDKLSAGDVVIFKEPNHIAIYMGEDQIIHHGGGSDGKTPGPTIGKIYGKSSRGQTYMGARRFLVDDPASLDSDSSFDMDMEEGIDIEETSDTTSNTTSSTSSSSSANSGYKSDRTSSSNNSSLLDSNNLEVSMNGDKSEKQKQAEATLNKLINPFAMDPATIYKDGMAAKQAAAQKKATTREEWLEQVKSNKTLNGVLGDVKTDPVNSQDAKNILDKYPTGVHKYGMGKVIRGLGKKQLSNEKHIPLSEYAKGKDKEESVKINIQNNTTKYARGKDSSPRYGTANNNNDLTIQLMKMMINLLQQIANNSTHLGQLSTIVSLLSDQFDVVVESSGISKEEATKLNKIKSQLRKIQGKANTMNQGTPTGFGNSLMDQDIGYLMTAMSGIITD